ncbi:MAG: HU family DNA-binding protein [Pseudomonadota bacterium]
MTTRRKTTASTATKPAGTASKTPASAKTGSTIAKSAKTASVRPAPAAVTAKPELVRDTSVEVAGADLKKRELIDKVVERSGVRKRFAKPAVEAMIDILGEAISEGRGLNLQPLGKLKHQRRKETGNATITVAKIRQSKSASPVLDKAKESVAEPDE